MAQARLLAAFRHYLETIGEPVVSDFLRGLERDILHRLIAPQKLPVTRHLPSMVTSATGAPGALVSALFDCADTLAWHRSYTSGDFGTDFLENYGWTELFGTRGFFASETVAGGFLLLGPHVEYPDHDHLAEEIYIPLTCRSLWRMAGSDFAVREPGAVIHHASGVSHAMRTQDTALCALYLWRGGPLSQKPNLKG